MRGNLDLTRVELLVVRSDVASCPEEEPKIITLVATLAPSQKPNKIK